MRWEHKQQITNRKWWECVPYFQFLWKEKSLGIKWKWRGYWYGLILWEKKPDDFSLRKWWSQ